MNIYGTQLKLITNVMQYSCAGVIHMIYQGTVGNETSCRICTAGILQLKTGFLPHNNYRGNAEKEEGGGLQIGLLWTGTL
jgi:hypothetical protein